MSRRGTTLSDIDEGLMIPVSDRDAVWEKVVDVLHVYQFQIISENHLEGVIETDYKVGASLIEPWHRDSVGFHDRFESTLQSIRRKVFISVSPSGNGQCVSVEVHKEIEDVDGKAYNSPGGATFQEYQPFRRDLRAVVGQSAPSGWIFQGRDAKLEQALLRSISREFE